MLFITATNVFQRDEGNRPSNRLVWAMILMKKRFWVKFIVFVLSISVAGLCFGAGEWPQYLGPDRNGSASAPGLFGDKVALEQIWIQPLGSGFSGIVIGMGKVYTMHAEPESENELGLMPSLLTKTGMDALSCFDAATGRKLWSYEYGPAFPKVGHSEAGPLSTPVLDGNRIYSLGARGELFCLNAGNGQLIWARNLIKDFGIVPDEVGTSSSPLVSGDWLILNMGDLENKGIGAFDKNTGELAWHTGSEKVTHQSPSLVTLMGRGQVIAMSEDKTRGLEPATGKLIWEHDSKNWMQAYAIGSNLMLFGKFEGIALHHVDENGKVMPTEKWYNETLALEYDMPVHYKGYLYGLKRGFISCLELETGKKVWSSRDAGRGTSILVDSHLAILSDDGFFRIARAWEKGYAERASIKVFEKVGLTTPSYADRVFYMRNYTHLTAVRVK